MEGTRKTRDIRDILAVLLLVVMVFSVIIAFRKESAEDYDASFRKGIALGLKRAIADYGILLGEIPNKEYEELRNKEDEMIAEFSIQKVQEFNKYLNELTGLSDEDLYEEISDGDTFITGYMIQIQKNLIDMSWGSGIMEEQLYLDINDVYEELIFKETITPNDVQKYLDKVAEIVEGRLETEGDSDFSYPHLLKK